MLAFYNYLSRKIEEFKPISGKIVGMYTCGPTVYDYVHIGNWRTFVFEDILKRALTFNGYKVKHVMNITDIDDKIIKKADEEKVDFKVITNKYEKLFKEDLSKLNIIPADHFPKATEHINHMVSLIEKLLDMGFAYKAEDGVYFSVEKFEKYGELSGLEKKQLKKGARVNEDQYDKENWSDFALWKFHQPRSSPGLEPSWDAPFGKGRPGWHIECSEMSMDILGGHFDIHCGGVDLLFPHHENEIAQSEASTSKKFVDYWLEGEHLLVDGKKMSKSLGNFLSIFDLETRGFDPLAFRYLVLTAHYRSQLNFTWESLEASGNALNNLREQVASWDEPKIGRSDSESLQTRTSCSEFEGDFKEAIDDDLDMPQALAVMWEMVKSDYPSSAKHQSVLVMDKVFGLGLDKIRKQQLPKGAKELIDRREEFRKAGEFEESDNLRKELLGMGVEVEDTPQGPKWNIKKDRIK